MLYEFKIKDGSSWEDSKIIESCHFKNEAIAFQHAKATADKYRKEVRMNARGSYQGRYAMPLDSNAIPQ